ncbi:MAG: hypothetical protein DBX55_09220 [Verrucomicrobia bacterium]|nr:MAG: hypothetical protein DBX55_09220 [Verrucomicrobiota bacterium]
MRFGRQLRNQALPKGKNPNLVAQFLCGARNPIQTLGARRLAFRHWKANAHTRRYAGRLICARAKIRRSVGGIFLRALRNLRRCAAGKIEFANRANVGIGAFRICRSCAVRGNRALPCCAAIARDRAAAA